jgi:hypothetical protein
VPCGSIRLDNCDALPVPHRFDCNSDRQRALAASAFLGDQSKDIHLLRVPDDNDMKRVVEKIGPTNR